ncbi:SET domain-containing protein SmydA-8-like [Artemia franciscana]|uniref:Uncharacterized protein n=1 Tax=Artemia franciscana TaxID=6661 RepID=A0AA88LDN1_ARTSF|nr:hypothetical protein QYM36_008210 [Artemia franciscana]
MESCAACFKPATQKCSGCRVIYYCARECQKRHWKAHKDLCRPYLIERDEELGRCLVASRDFEAGEILLKEPPLVIAPAKFTKPICLGCHKKSKTLYNCSMCGWPVCSKSCEKSRLHEPECTLTSRGRKGEQIVLKDLDKEHPAMGCIAILRVLHIKETDEKKWTLLMQLEDHVEARRALGHEEVDRATIVRFILQYLNLGQVYDELLVLKICGIVTVNGFEVPMESGMLTALYPTACFIENNCAPNCTRNVTKAGDIVIRSTLSIMKGDHIAICYTDPLWGTINRQTHLQNTKYFRCKCTRCRDPTELGTCMSSVRCQKCSGFVQPQDPLDEECSWKCDRCGMQIEPIVVNELVEKIGEELVKIGKGGTKDLEAFIEKNKKLLHPHHFYMCDAKLALAQTYGHECEKGLFALQEDQLQRKENLCLELLRVVDAVAQGKSRLRGILLYELQALVALRSRQGCLDGTISRDELLHKVKAVKSMLEEASLIFGWEAEDVGEGQLAAIARKELEDVQMFYESISY